MKKIKTKCERVVIVKETKRIMSKRGYFMINEHTTHDMLIITNPDYVDVDTLSGRNQRIIRQAETIRYLIILCAEAYK